MTRAPYFLAILWLVPGCAPFERVTTEVRVTDPSDVSLGLPDGDVVIPASSEPTEAPLAEGRAQTGTDSSAAYEVVARRETDRSLSVEWSTALPLAQGERHTVVPTNGTFTFSAPMTSIVTPSMAAAPSLRLPWCTTLDVAGYRGVTSYRVEPRGCFDQGTPDPRSHVATAPYVLDVPWRSVATIHEHTDVDHGSAWLIIGVSTLSFGAMSTMFFAMKSTSFKGGMPTKIALGASTAAIGLAFDFAMLPTLLASDRDRFVRRSP